jgi:hypothetical protein
MKKIVNSICSRWKALLARYFETNGNPPGAHDAFTNQNSRVIFHHIQEKSKDLKELF